MVSLGIADSCILEEESVSDRLAAVKTAVQKATKEALQHATEVSFVTGASGKGQQLQQQQQQTYPGENKDPNASFHLGMELFGQEVSEIQRNILRELTKLEGDLEDILHTARHQNEEDGIFSAGDEGGNKSNMTLEELEENGETLKTKIAFLKECSTARSLLDKSVTLSSPALAPNEEVDCVEAARLLVRAQRALAAAQDVVQSKATTDEPLTLKLKTAYTIIDSIRDNLRRQRADLTGRARSLWQTCITLQPHSLEVRGGNNGGSPTDSSATSVSGLVVAYQVLETFEADDISNDSSLTDMLSKFTNTLYHDVFEPVLKSHQQPETSHSTILSRLPWEFKEVEDRVSTTALSSSKLVTSSKNRCPVRRLEWSRIEDEKQIISMNVNSSESKGSTPNNLADWKETISFISRIVDFVVDQILLHRPALCRAVGDRLFGKPGALSVALNLDALGLENCRIGNDSGLLMEPLVDAMMKTCIPQQLPSDELGKLHLVAEELRSFMNPFLCNLVAKNLLSKESDSRCAVFVSNFEQHYLDNRRCVILNEARHLLIHNDYHNTVEVGVDVHQNKDDQRLGIDDGMGVFLLHKSSVSDTAKKLMELCRRAMDEAVLKEAAPKESPLALLPANLYRAAREVLDLFRAIIPVKYGNEVHNVPRTAAVLHNDCVFFAHHCLTLGLEYKDKFPPVEVDDVQGNLLRQTCMFVDMVPLFRDLADRSMGDMLDLQAKQILEIVGQRIPLLGKALRSDEILAEWSDAETATTAGLYHLRHLSQSWHPVLSYDVFNRSILYLADVLFSLFLDQVTKATDISIAGAHFVSTLFRKASDEIGELVQNDTSGSRVWDRFCAIGQCMDMSLADIQVALSNGVFRSVTGPELTQIIKATFDDTPKRQHVLGLLASN